MGGKGAPRWRVSGHVLVTTQRGSGRTLWPAERGEVLPRENLGLVLDLGRVDSDQAGLGSAERGPVLEPLEIGRVPVVEIGGEPFGGGLGRADPGELVPTMLGLHDYPDAFVHGPIVQVVALRRNGFAVTSPGAGTA